jgi:hypothetical protein
MVLKVYLWAPGVTVTRPFSTLTKFFSYRYLDKISESVYWTFGLSTSICVQEMDKLSHEQKARHGSRY